MNEKGHLADLNIDGRMILKLIERKGVGWDQLTLDMIWWL
jgi:hypothetical protein